MAWLKGIENHVAENFSVSYTYPGRGFIWDTNAHKWVKGTLYDVDLDSIGEVGATPEEKEFALRDIKARFGFSGNM